MNNKLSMTYSLGGYFELKTGGYYDKIKKKNPLSFDSLIPRSPDRFSS
jgi:hypothetical protein